jgi:hypothetical protein
MLICIPPFRKRDLPVDESKSLWDGLRRIDGMEYSEDEIYSDVEVDEDEDEDEDD